MHKRHTREWSKHFDFMFIDMLCLQLCFVLSYWLRFGFSNPYQFDAYQYQLIVLTLSQLFVILFTTSYKGVLRRGSFDELLAVIKYIGQILLVAVVYLFVVHSSQVASRLQFGATILLFVMLDYLFRQLNKWRILHFDTQQKKSIAVVTSAKLVRGTVKRLNSVAGYQDYFISLIILLDSESKDEFDDLDIPVMALCDATVHELGHIWVDEAFVLQPEDMPPPMELMNELVEMGITVNYTMAAMGRDGWPGTDVRKFGGYKVLTGGISVASAGKLAIKRIMDVVGGIVGCLLTVIIFIFIAPIIYKNSPGPIFFSQKRVGRGGKVFTMYKFRSMYMDAEERKASLASQNKVEDGMMFKIPNDPRIISNGKRDKKGRPRGIGYFIRRTSLDEFPQFLNVLKGDMSLVGTRPPTLDEWEKYDMEHRVRLSIKPGITGLWQVSGRSAITKFSEVVHLDRKYIDEWSISLDVKIILKTVVVVIRRSGAV